MYLKEYVGFHQKYEVKNKGYYMKSWAKLLLSILRVALIVVLVGFAGACTQRGDGEDSENAVVCDAGETCTSDHYDKDCSGCKIIKKILDSINNNYERLQKIYSDGAPVVLTIAFAIWLALRLLKFVSSVTENNAGEVWNEILHKAFICVICLTIVASPAALNAFINTFIMPIYMAFLELGVKILEASKSNLPSGNSVAFFGETLDASKATFSCATQGSFNIQFTEHGFSDSYYNTLSCLIKYLRDNLSVGGKMGFEAMRRSGGVLNWLIGLIFYLAFVIVKMFFVFYLVDSIFQMGIIVFLLPVFVVAYAFGPTRKWANKAFVYMIAASSFLMCFSVLIAMVIRGMIELIANNSYIFNPEGDAAKDDVSVGWMCMILLAFLITGSLGVAAQVSNSFVGGKTQSNFQKRLKSVVQMGGKLAWKAFSGLISFGAAAFPNNRVMRAVNRIKGASHRVSQLAGREKEE